MIDKWRFDVSIKINGQEINGLSYSTNLTTTPTWQKRIQNAKLIEWHPDSPDIYPIEKKSMWEKKNKQYSGKVLLETVKESSVLLPMA